MNTALWLSQIFLSFVFVGAGVMKLVKSKAALEQHDGFSYVTERTAVQMKLIGLAETLGAIGLLVPWLFGSYRVLTPVAAASLAVLMVGALATHHRRHESVTLVIVLFVLLVFTAVGRAML